MVRETSQSILVQEKARSKARINRSLEHNNNNNNKKKSRVEETFNADNIEYEEETNAGMSILMDTDGIGIDPYIKVITPDVVLTNASDNDSNIESDSDSNSDYEHK